MAALRYLSVCSGIEAATVAWHPLGWQPVAFSEIEKFPSQVLAHHYPDVPNLGDMTKFEEWTNVSDVDVLVGGTPCQSFSVAGLRKGLHDPRGGLMLTFIEIAQRYRPRWIVWENVPGVLSSNGGRDFGSFLAALGELGYGWAYRVLDAQWFGVAQRRRRVFVVGCLGDQRSAAKVLFESESVCRNTPPSREKKQDIASTITSSLGSGGANDMTPMVAKCITTGIAQRLDSETETMIPLNVGSLCTRTGRSISVQDADQNHLMPTYALVGNTIGRKPENGGNGNGWSEEISYTLTKTDVHGVAQPICLMDQGGSVMNVENNITGTLRRETHGHEPVVIQPIGFDAYNNDVTGSVTKTIDTGQDYHHVPNVLQRMAVRRLTPVECERLQGFPDGYTDIKENTPDGPRYKALGNSMAVPVMRWIGERIDAA